MVSIITYDPYGGNPCPHPTAWKWYKTRLNMVWCVCGVGMNVESYPEFAECVPLIRHCREWRPGDRTDRFHSRICRLKLEVPARYWLSPIMRNVN